MSDEEQHQYRNEENGDNFALPSVIGDAIHERTVVNGILPEHSVHNSRSQRNVISASIGRSIPDVRATGADGALVMLLLKRDKTKRILENCMKLAEILLETNNTELLIAELANVDSSLYEFMEVSERC